MFSGTYVLINAESDIFKLLESFLVVIMTRDVDVNDITGQKLFL